VEVEHVAVLRHDPPIGRREDGHVDRRDIDGDPGLERFELGYVLSERAHHEGGLADVEAVLASALGERVPDPSSEGHVDLHRAGVGRVRREHPDLVNHLLVERPVVKEPAERHLRSAVRERPISCGLRRFGLIGAFDETAIAVRRPTGPRADPLARWLAKERLYERWFRTTAMTDPRPSGDWLAMLQPLATGVLGRAAWRTGLALVHSRSIACSKTPWRIVSVFATVFGERPVPSRELSTGSAWRTAGRVRRGRG